MNIFNKPGDKDTTELYDKLRLGRVESVDEANAVVTISWLDKSGIRSQVPLTMPFCEQGWGMYAMPRKYGIVVCEMRPQEFPIIIGYLPPNYMTPDSFWGQHKQITGLPDMKSGEMVVRNLINRAKCKACGVISGIEEWALNNRIDDATGISMEHCPDCGAPMAEFQGDVITTVNKIQMGILMYFQEDGKLKIKLNDGLSGTDQFTDGSLITIDFDDQSNMTINGIQNLNVTMENLVALINKDANVTVNGNVTETVEGDVAKTVKGNVTEDVTGNVLVKSPSIKLGDDQALSLVVAQKLITAITTLLASLTTHSHVSPVGPTGPAVPPFQNTIQQAVIETVKVKGS